MKPEYDWHRAYAAYAAGWGFAIHYGDLRWPSTCFWLVPGTCDPSA